MGWYAVWLWWLVLCMTSLSPLLAVAASPTAGPPPATTDMEQERQRFTRLQRQGIIEVYHAGPSGTLRLTIEPLVWGRLTPAEQHNFLRRAQRLFGGTVVQMHSRHADDLLARLTASGEFESFTESSVRSPQSSPQERTP